MSYAFPTSVVDRITPSGPLEPVIRGGLSKREYAAVAALQGVLSQAASIDLKPDVVARYAIDCADSLFSLLDRTAHD